MCENCGCDAQHVHTTTENEHSHHHHHHHPHEKSIVIDVQQNVLAKNQLVAEQVRGYMMAKNVLCINIMGSPGSGKTTLLEETIKKMRDLVPIAVIEGDQQTTNDADRIKALNVPSIQINTETGCHLNADSVLNSVKILNPAQDSILIIESIGNLVCPSLFDLGEKKRVVVLSVTEGDDKPLKYPYMIQCADICIVHKIDLLPYVNSDLSVLHKNLLTVNPNIIIFDVSSTSKEGVDEWCDYLTLIKE